MVIPVHPFQSCVLDVVQVFPGATLANHFGLVQPDDGFGQGVVVAVADATDRRLDLGFGQSLGVPNGQVLRPPVAVMGEPLLVGPACPNGLIQSIQYQVGPASVEWGSNLIYAAVQQFGASKGAFGTARNGTSIPWGTIPARPFIGVSDEDETALVDLIEDWLQLAAGSS